MNGATVADTRNFVLMGHTGSGKTALVDALLFKLGVNDRLGSVDNGSSLSDYTDEEKERKTSIYASCFHAAYKADGHAFSYVFTDTPGYADFHGQVVAASHVADAALIVVDAHAGIQIGSMRAWRLCEQQGKPRAIVITGIDRENTDFEKVLQSIQSAWGAQCAPVAWPAGDGSIVGVLSGAVPPALTERVAEMKNSLVERAAETDDAMIEKFLGGEKLTDEEIRLGLRKAVASGRLVPVFFCVPPRDRGLDVLLDGIGRLLPSPADVQHKDAEGKPVEAKADAPLTAFVWRCVNDPYIGHLAFLRIFAGTFRSESEVVNVNKGEKERLGAGLAMNGRKQDPVKEATPGDIVALAKLKHTGLNDVLGVAGKSGKWAPIHFPNPVTSFAVHAKSKGDEDKIGMALGRLTEDDPTIKVERNTETKETVLSGLGDVHIESAVDRMRRRQHIEVTLTTPKIPYRETVTGKGEGHYRHKKQSGGRGQYGEVYLRVEPRDPKDEEWFVDGIVGGVIPHNFIPAVEKGLHEGLEKGCLAHFPVMNVKVTIYDGSYHDVDSSEIAFKIAASRALRDGMEKARPVLLEPIMKVNVAVPVHFAGDVNGDLNHKRGRIVGMDSQNGLQVVTADVPLAEMFRYGAELRSMTGGQGSFSMEFSRYEIVPGNIAQKVVAEAGVKKEEE